MIILTGKAKAYFLSWYSSGFIDLQDAEEDFSAESEYGKWGYYISWLDSVGIFIKITPVRAINIEFCYKIIGYKVVPNFFHSRERALKAAVEKANEIYNNK